MINIRSDEELYFYWWLEELKSKKLCNYIYEPEVFSLFKGDKHIIKFKSCSITPRSVNYTPDFIIKWSEKLRGILFSIAETNDKKSVFVAFVRDSNLISYIDVKGGFTRGRGSNSSAITFPLKQKWMLQKYNIYVQKIIPVGIFNKKKNIQEGLFVETFTPAKYMITAKGHQRELKYSPCMINKYLEKYDI